MTSGDEPYDGSDCDTHSTNARPPAHHLGIDGDPLESVHDQKYICLVSASLVGVRRGCSGIFRNARGISRDGLGYLAQCPRYLARWVGAFRAMPEASHEIGSGITRPPAPPPRSFAPPRRSSPA